MTILFDFPRFDTFCLTVQWPKGITAKGELRHAVGHVIDIVSTLLKIVGVQPGGKWYGLGVPPLPGRSYEPRGIYCCPRDRGWTACPT
jgi:hypothetical protein